MMKLPGTNATSAIYYPLQRYPNRNVISNEPGLINAAAVIPQNDQLDRYKYVIAITRNRIQHDCHDNCKDPSNVNDRSSLLGIYEACTRCAEARRDELQAYIAWNRAYQSHEVAEINPYSGNDLGHLRAVIYSATWADAARYKLDHLHD
jgi:hypothetical protein